MEYRASLDAPGDEIGPDRAAFVAFYETEHRGQVRRAYLLVRSNEMAHDIVHDAMVGVWRRWNDLQNPGGYLNQAVLNGCRDAGRRRATHNSLIGRLGRLGRNVTDRAEAEVLDDVLAALPFNQRAAVVMRYYGGLTTAEIADALGCPANSIGPWITRALTAMRRELS
jgi:RNA polymerase sigma factor (sigma-70 family)